MGTVLDAEVNEELDEAYGLSRVVFPGGALLVGGVGRPVGAHVRAQSWRAT